MHKPHVAQGPLSPLLLAMVLVIGVQCRRDVHGLLGHGGEGDLFAYQVATNTWNFRGTFGIKISSDDAGSRGTHGVLYVRQILGEGDGGNGGLAAGLQILDGVAAGSSRARSSLFAMEGFVPTQSIQPSTRTVSRPVLPVLNP